MTERISIGNLQIEQVLYDLVCNEIIPGTGINADELWQQFEQLLTDLMPVNRALLEKRDEMQSQIDLWHQQRSTQPLDPKEYQAYLRQIGYLLDEGSDFEIKVENVDEEIALLAGPQLVVPVMNARYALNAANARWGSLYDALYGTDVIPEDAGAEKGGAYNPVRGSKVIDYSSEFLNRSAPLAVNKYQDICQYEVSDNNLRLKFEDGSYGSLKNPEQFRGYLGKETDPSGILLVNNGLHIEIQIDREDSVGRDDKAGVKDLLIEAAISTIQDCEDSVAAVDAEDKVIVYRNWLGLMKGDLAEEFVKGEVTIRRELNPDRIYKVVES